MDRSAAGTTVGVVKRAAAEGKTLHGRVRGWGRKCGCDLMLGSDITAWQVRSLSTLPDGEATGHERSFEKERQRTPRQREWPAKHPLPSRGRRIAGEWDQLSRVCIEQHGGGGFLPSLKIPQSLPHP